MPLELSSELSIQRSAKHGGFSGGFSFMPQFTSYMLTAEIMHAPTSIKKLPVYYSSFPFTAEVLGKSAFSSSAACASQHDQAACMQLSGL